ncbi:MAG: flap endonuclease [Candidatus Eremiobacteraeota bacterium]|nr:flap endonuclease [Candidatus Eremiobacteraeota bacterium]
MKIHAIDGTYELFRNHFGAPSSQLPDGQEVGATRGFMRSMVGMLRDPEVTHVGVAFDTVIESFRNRMFAGYKTGEGIEPELKSQFPLIEEAAEALGLVVWRMVEFEADDALASVAARFADQVDQVLLCSPDKDLAQCVIGQKVVCFDRRKQQVMDDDGVRAKFGIDPASIPDYLGLVGDSADGIPGLKGWGAKSTATVLAHYGHLEAIPDDHAQWQVKVRGGVGLAATLADQRENALLYRELARLRRDVPIEEDLEALEWRGVPRERFEAFCEKVGERELANRVERWR